MDRLKKVAGLWTFLPTFRVVAELEHVTRAASVLGVSPSAVSRTISLLEGQVGHPLFARAGRRISLNGAGEELLASVRAAMRIVDDGLAAADDRRFSGPLRVGAVEPFLTCLAAGTFHRLRGRFPRVVPTLERPVEQDVARLVLSGVVDVAFVRTPPTAQHVVITRLRAFETAVFRNPILATEPDGAGSGAPTVVVEVTQAPKAGSPWPPDRAKRVAVFVPDYDAALHACVGAAFAAVLPVEMVARHELGGRLRRLDAVRTAPVTLFAVRREVILAKGSAEAAVECALEECALGGASDQG